MIIDLDINRKTEEAISKISEKIKKMVHQSIMVQYIGSSTVETYLIRFGTFSNIKIKYHLWPDGTEKFIWQIDTSDMSYDRPIEDEIKNIVRREVAKYLDTLHEKV